MRGLALASVIANAVIMSTGEAVRLSKSGLGCPDWPNCTARSLVAAGTAGQTTLNTWIEFGNRLLNVPLVAIAGFAFIAAWRYRPPGRRRPRRDLVWLAAALPGGVIGQAVIGGVVVLTKLNPAWVAVHFLLSTAILGAAVVLHVRCGEGDGPATPVVRRDLRLIGAALVPVVALMFAAGTVVTGTGPLAGNAAAPRFRLPFVGVTQFHADIGWLLTGLSFALILGLTVSGAPRRAARRELAARRADPGPGRDRVRAVLQRPARRPGLGARHGGRGDLDRHHPAVPGAARPRPDRAGPVRGARRGAHGGPMPTAAAMPAAAEVAAAQRPAGAARSARVPGA